MSINVVIVYLCVTNNYITSTTTTTTTADGGLWTLAAARAVRRWGHGGGHEYAQSGSGLQSGRGKLHTYIFYIIYIDDTHL